MTISTTSKVRFAFVTVFAATAIVAACGNGDDDDTTPKSDAGTKLDATGGGTPDTGGGSGPEAGSTDASVVDAADAGDSGDPALDCDAYLHCDDFESYTDAAFIANNSTLGWWSTSVTGDTDAGETAKMGVDSIRPYSGNFALHVTTPAGSQSQGELVRNSVDGGDIGPVLYGRAMVYFSGGPLPGGSAPLTDSGTYGLASKDPSGYVHSWIFKAGGQSDELDAAVSANIIVGNPKLALNYAPGDYGPGATADASDVTLSTWHCLQWQYDGSGSPVADVANVWFDGVLSVHTDPTIKYGSGDAATPLHMAQDWTSLYFGFTHYQNTNIPQDVYLDDLAIDNKMVPCPTP